MDQRCLVAHAVRAAVHDRTFQARATAAAGAAAGEWIELGRVVPRSNTQAQVRSMGATLAALRGSSVVVVHASVPAFALACSRLPATGWVPPQLQLLPPEQLPPPREPPRPWSPLSVPATIRSCAPPHCPRATRAARTSRARHGCRAHHHRCRRRRRRRYWHQRPRHCYRGDARRHKRALWRCPLHMARLYRANRVRQHRHPRLRSETVRQGSAFCASRCPR